MKGWLSIYAAAFFAFLHVPLLTLAVFSLNSGRFTHWEHFSLDWYRAIFRDAQIMEGLARLGHDVEELGQPYSETCGHAGMLVKHPRDGRVEAAHDPRSDGGAAGL